MSKIDKRIESWRNTKQDIPKSDIEPVLKKYFGGWFPNKGTSHEYKLQHAKLVGIEPYGQGGCLTICVKNGTSIKPIYIKKLLKAIDIIKNDE